jgi:hypothetical protein
VQEASGRRQILTRVITRLLPLSHLGITGARIVDRSRFDGARHQAAAISAPAPQAIGKRCSSSDSRT